MRTSRGLKWENKMYKLKRSIGTHTGGNTWANYLMRWLAEGLREKELRRKCHLCNY